MNQIWFRPLVWMDYRLAVVFTVVLPLMLLFWAIFQKKEAIVKLLIIYWRVASLLMITIYLLIPGWRIGFFTGIFARLLIIIALWFWVDLNEEIRDLPKRTLKIAFTSWRWATTIYCFLGILASLLFIPCGLSASKLNTPFCQVWLEAPQFYRTMFHNKPDNEGFLGFMGMVGLTIYLLYLLYFVLVRLGKQGRSALEQ
ncbi:hypothetical protein Sta7437_3267 [Stanieria cyanosphaera PCC 7437]|uniref:DUF3177 domain-containing protein n=1 Tax=Stanieria cyanosphaera (strain ATCC 29371 / PCC 7437) TaxID=111780 RepID=K9XXI9_STAC7|nr:DUF3177 family protein [Stanieria cyanosphaera]AFZ36774.1 hypothetical protein Sta7437_3267 [Stanieria cyanosphaera PCC 7437]